VTGHAKFNSANIFARQSALNIHEYKLGGRKDEKIFHANLF
jgi:hypothetical protein